MVAHKPYNVNRFYQENLPSCVPVIARPVRRLAVAIRSPRPQARNPHAFPSRGRCPAGADEVSRAPRASPLPFPPNSSPYLPQNRKNRHILQNPLDNQEICGIIALSAGVLLLWRFNKLKTKHPAEISKSLGSVNNEKSISNHSGPGHGHRAVQRQLGG